MQGGSLRTLLLAVLLVTPLLVLAPQAGAQGGGFTPIGNPPYADFRWEPENVAAGQNVTFIDTSIAGSKPIWKWIWNLGDGRSFEQRGVGKARVNFSEPGNYSVTLTVEDKGGHRESTTKQVRIYPAHDVRFTITQNGTTVHGDATGSSSPNGQVVAYTWIWGDGAPNATTPRASHTFTAPGTYRLQFIVKDSLGTEGVVWRTVVIPDEPPLAAFTVDVTPARVNQTVTFRDASTALFGPISAREWLVDGTVVGTGATLRRAFDASGTYNVTLRVTDARNATAELSRPLRVAVPPVAAFDVALDGRTVTVDGTNATDPDGAVASWVWDWGDGSAASPGRLASHTYPASGAYAITLTVTDGDGFTATATRRVEIAGRPVTVAFTATPDKVKTGEEIRFTDASSDPEGPILRWEWSFGDGNAGLGPEAFHRYARAGTYAVNLTVTDSQGGLARASRTVVVEAAPAPATPTPGGIQPTPSPTHSVPSPERPDTPTTPTGQDPTAVTRTGATPTGTNAANEVPAPGVALLALLAVAVALLRRR